MKPGEDLADGQVTGSRLILQNAHLDALGTALQAEPETLKLTKIFSSESGWYPSLFHQACDNKGPSLVVMKSPVLTKGKTHYLCGYTNLAWASSSSPKNICDDKARLFRYDLDPHNQLSSMELFSPSGQQAATVFHYTNSGPAFGPSGSDFTTMYASPTESCMCLSSTQNAFDFRGKIFLEMVQEFAGTKRANGNTSSGRFELEVLLVERVTPFLQGPWLPGVDWSSKVRSYTPPE